MGLHSALADVKTQADWIAFEGEQWRDAVFGRGLSIRSIDRDEQLLLCEAIKRDITAKLTRARARISAASGSLAAPPTAHGTLTSQM
jgi:hypothetical protein